MPRPHGEQPGHAQHHGRGVDTRDGCAQSRRVPSRGTRATTDVDYHVSSFELAETSRKPGVTASPDHAERGDQTHGAGKARVVRMVVRRNGLFLKCHTGDVDS
jgi:hypothetical protein